MSKTVDDLTRLAMREAQDFRNKMLVTGQAYSPHDECYVVTRSVVRALRDEIIPERMRLTRANDTCTRSSLRRYFNQILGSDAGNEKVAGGPTREDERSVEQLGATSSHATTSPATDPAPAPCLWRVHHQTRNGPLYVSQCDGEWRHATSDPKCPSCGKEVFFPATDPCPHCKGEGCTPHLDRKGNVYPEPCQHCETTGRVPATDPAPAVCEWTYFREKPDLPAMAPQACHQRHAVDVMLAGKWVCSNCNKPIKFTEAK